MPKTGVRLEPKALRAFPSEKAACAAMIEQARPSEGQHVACGPIQTRHDCRVVRAPQSAITLIEVAIVDTMGIEHCASDAKAARMDVNSAIVAPMTRASKGLRVALDSSLYVPHSGGTMLEGFADGRAEIVTTATLGDSPDADDVIVLRTTQSSGCSLVFTVCDHARSWCTEPVEAWRSASDCQDAEVPNLLFARAPDAVRVDVGAETILFAFARPADVTASSAHGETAK